MGLNSDKTSKVFCINEILTETYGLLDGVIPNDVDRPRRTQNR